MKKFTFILLSLLTAAFTVKAQQYVSTEPSNRNVILEEFTGRNCGYCPDGHLIANQIMANNPGRVWAINVHAGSYAPTSYPNFNTVDGTTIHGGFSISGYPTGVVNRSTAAGQSRGAWNGLSNTQLNQAAECNVAGAVSINPETRVASITVEIYYTGDSGYDENYLTVAMLQDSILGSQSGGSSNPAQMVNGTYCHMHILRDVITESAWGDAISPTTQGTLITKTYEYQIPEVIGSPNGVDVIIDHVFFLAWVSERFQGTPARPILNACELEKTSMSDDPIHPAINGLAQVLGASCSQVKTFGFNLVNIGKDQLNSVKFNAQVGDVTTDFEWAGVLESGESTTMNFDMELPFGTFTGELNIVEANGEAFEDSKSFEAECTEWGETEVPEELTTFKIFIFQDQNGEQITWDVINSAGEVVAAGGPYTHLLSAGIYGNVEQVTGVPSDECYLFRIYDSGKDGICCNYGNGYYYIKDANGNKIVEGDGDFGAMASNLFSIKKVNSVESNEAEMFSIYPNPAENKIFVEGENISMVELYNSLGQKVLSVEGASKTSVDVSSCDNGVYFVRVLTNDGVATTKKVTVVK